MYCPLRPTLQPTKHFARGKAAKANSLHNHPCADLAVPDKQDPLRPHPPKSACVIEGDAKAGPLGSRLRGSPSHESQRSGGHAGRRRALQRSPSGAGAPCAPAVRRGAGAHRHGCVPQPPDVCGQAALLQQALDTHTLCTGGRHMDGRWPLAALLMPRHSPCLPRSKVDIDMLDFGRCCLPLVHRPSMCACPPCLTTSRPTLPAGGG